MNDRPLAGLKVIDFSTVFAGPICSRFLLDCGADVVKIETPGFGDLIRTVEGLSKPFAHFNAGKRSVALDLKHPEGRAIARELIDRADIVIENFRPGIMQKFGLDYATLKPELPQLVYCSISGFGQSGPQRNRAAFAPIIHAASGFDSVMAAAQGGPDHRPPVWQIMVADILTGAYAFGAVQTALLSRLRFGHGGYVDISMLESMMQLLPNQIQAAQTDPRPYIGVYCPIKTRDGYVMACVITEKNLQNLCAVLGRPELANDERFIRANRYENINALEKEIERWTINHRAEECEKILTDAGVPCSIYQSPEDLFFHPQVLERKPFSPVRNDKLGEFLVQKLPALFSQFDSSTADFVAGLGEHTDEVLRERLQKDPNEIARLRGLGVLG